MVGPKRDVAYRRYVSACPRPIGRPTLRPRDILLRWAHVSGRLPLARRGVRSDRAVWAALALLPEGDHQSNGVSRLPNAQDVSSGPSLPVPTSSSLSSLFRLRIPVGKLIMMSSRVACAGFDHTLYRGIGQGQGHAVLQLG